MRKIGLIVNQGTAIPNPAGELSGLLSFPLSAIHPLSLLQKFERECMRYKLSRKLVNRHRVLTLVEGAGSRAGSSTPTARTASTWKINVEEP